MKEGTEAMFYEQLDGPCRRRIVVACGDRTWHLLAFVKAIVVHTRRAVEKCTASKPTPSKGRNRSGSVGALTKSPLWEPILRRALHLFLLSHAS